MKQDEMDEADILLPDPPKDADTRTAAQVGADWIKSRQQDIDDQARKRENDRLKELMNAEGAANDIIAAAGLSEQLVIDTASALMNHANYKGGDDLSYTITAGLPEGVRLEVHVRRSPKRGTWGPRLENTNLYPEPWLAKIGTHCRYFSDAAEALAILFASDEDRKKYWPNL